MKNKLLNRVLVSLIFGPVTLLVFYAGGIFLQVFLGILIFGMLYEFRKNFQDKGTNLPVTQLLFGEIVYLALLTGKESIILAAVFLTFIILGGEYIFRNQSEGAIRKIAVSLFSILYVSLFLSMVYGLRQLASGREIVISLLLTVWLTDTFAYFTGISIGRHQGVVPVSPKKSLEGFIGGLVFSIIGSYLLVKLFNLPLGLIWMFALSSGICGQFGDLFESLLKRDLKIKDSSHLMQEHGGILDRFDSLLFSAPALYILIRLIGV
ncbi:MAG: phosphatidate cytidylyltransferase [Candidatus Cloacimonetes bacterium]|nr:phosphatidate cytidylyltransferase [Candidatus Cloacimonadota bacterium]